MMAQESDNNLTHTHGGTKKEERKKRRRKKRRRKVEAGREERNVLTSTKY